MNPTNAPEIDVRLTLDRSTPNYAPGDMVLVTVGEPTDPLSEPATAELSILWHTSGKGEEDLIVHAFQRAAVGGPGGEELASLTLESELPASPLSYAGRAVKVCWCARLRLYLANGKQMVCEAPFRLGGVTPAQVDETSPAA